MAVFVHRKSRFNRLLDALKRGDKKSFLAAKRAQDIVKKLAGNPTPEFEHDEKMDYNDILMKKIDDNMLRKIFCGLCNKGS